MTALIDVTRPRLDNPEDQGRWYSEQLEEGNILFFPETPFKLPQELEFLRRQARQSGAAYHKNIAYRPNKDRLTGFASRSREEKESMRAIMRAYSVRVTRFLSELLPQYAASWRLDFASFRPQEEQGRQ